MTKMSASIEASALGMLHAPSVLITAIVTVLSVLSVVKLETKEGVKRENQSKKTGTFRTLSESCPCSNVVAPGLVGSLVGSVSCSH